MTAPSSAVVEVRNRIVIPVAPVGRVTFAPKCNPGAVSLQGVSLPLREAIQSVCGPNDEASVRDGGRRHGHLIQGVLAQQLELRACLDDEGVAVLAQGEDPAVVAPGRRAEPARLRRNTLAAVDLFPRPGIV